MKVVPLGRNSAIYTCNSYLILGDWNRLEDVNTLIDPGTDDYVLDEIDRLSTGCGKRAVEQVILTHEHFDHGGGAMAIKRRYGCRVLAFKAGNGIDDVLRHGEKITAGDRQLEVIHAPFHSHDSICLYCHEEGALFSGDTPLRIPQAAGSYSYDFAELLQRLARLRPGMVYPGHDPPWNDAPGVIRQSLANVKASLAGEYIPPPGRQDPWEDTKPAGIFLPADTTQTKRRCAPCSRT
jgi:glyoxylase-like metal-dependent hydrolase (beta-lactamase superfamily II)